MITHHINRLLGLTLAFLLSSVFVLIPIGEKAFSPVDLGILRFAIAGVVFLGLFVIGLVRYTPVQSSDRTRLVGMIGSIIVGQFLLNYAVLHIPSTIASLIVQAAPLLTLVISTLAGLERFRTRTAVGMGTAFAGTAVLILRSATGDGLELLSLPILAAGVVPVAIATYNFLGKPMAQRYGPANLTGQVLIAAAALMPLGVLVDPGLIPRAAAADRTSWLAVVGLALPATVFAYLLWAALLKRMSRSQVASTMYLVPVIAVVLAVFILGETIDASILTGGALVLGGLIVVDRGSTDVGARSTGRARAS